MVWLSTFCFRYSIRLGAILIIISSFVQVIVPLVIFVFCDATDLRNAAEIVRNGEMELGEHEIMDKLVDKWEDEPEEFIIYAMIFMITYVVTCLVATFGAYKLYKWLLIPYLLMEAVRFVILFITHVVSMIVLKKALNLGILIAVTVAGGFVLLFFGYLWVVVFSLYQVIGVVKSAKYRALYGDDPLENWTPIVETNSSIENVKFFRTPNFDKITPLKTERPANNNNGNNNNNTNFNYYNNRPRLKNDGVAIIPVNERDIHTAAREYQNWHVNELVGFKRSTLITFK